MIVPFSIAGIHAVDLDGKIKPGFIELLGIEKYLPLEIGKLTGNGGVDMPDLKPYFGMIRIQFPFVCIRRGRQKKYECHYSENMYSFHELSP